MQIYINKNGQQLGPFDEAKVKEMLQDGQLLPNDLGIRQGANEWQKLGTLFPNKIQTNLKVPIKEKNKKSIKIIGVLMLVLGSLVLLGLIMLIGLPLLMRIQHDPCIEATKSFSEMEQARKEYDELIKKEKDESYIFLDKKEKYDAINLKRMTAETWGSQCDEKKKFTVLFFVVGIFSLLLILIGGFLTFKK